MWAAREDGGRLRLEAALRDAGVDDGGDRRALAELLLDPALLGDAPDGAGALSPRQLAASFFGNGSDADGESSRTAASEIARRV